MIIQPDRHERSIISSSRRYDLDALPKVQDTLVNVCNAILPRAVIFPNLHAANVVRGCSGLALNTIDMLNAWPAEI